VDDWHVLCDISVVGERRERQEFLTLQSALEAMRNSLFPTEKEPKEVQPM
jgi:hypothetical protein